MSDVLDGLQLLRQAQQEVTRRRAKHEADVDRVEQVLRENVARLQSEFGVSSLQDARALLTERESDLAARVATIMKQMET